MEIAATDDDGNPSALRVTVTNVGDVPADMPILSQGCAPDNGIRLQSTWIPDEPSGRGYGSGYGCGIVDGPGLIYRVEHDWVRLRPGEFMTDTERLVWDRRDEEGRGTVEYWVEYTPPAVTTKEAANLLQSGYVIPAEKLETPHASFRVH